jgi:hypothetical protein
MFLEDMPVGSGFVRSFPWAVSVNSGVTLNDRISVDINYQDSPEQAIELQLSSFPQLN